MHRVIFNARAKTCFAQHLEVVLNPHTNALGFDEPVGLFEERHAFLEFGPDGLGCRLNAGGRSDVLVGGVEVELIKRLTRTHGDGIEFPNLLQRIAPEFQPDGGFHVGWPDIDGLAAGPEGTALEDGVVPRVLVGD